MNKIKQLLNQYKNLIILKVNQKLSKIRGHFNGLLPKINHIIINY